MPMSTETLLPVRRPTVWKYESAAMLARYDGSGADASTFEAKASATE